MSTTMTPEFIHRVREYVASLELADVPAPEVARSPSEMTEGGEQSFVDQGSLVSFIAGLGKQQKSDVLNSTLLAQLAANKKFNREEKPTEWYGVYREVLENVGWVIQQWAWDKTETQGVGFDMDKVVLKLLGPLAFGNQLGIMIGAMQAMKALPDEDGRVTVWESNSHAERSGNFQIGLAADSGGIAVMAIGCHYFSTSQVVKKVLWWRFTSDATTHYSSSQQINLDVDIYSQVRDAVSNKLGDNARKYVLEIEI